MKQDKTLTFEEFRRTIKGRLVHDNFFQHWAKQGSLAAASYREKPYAKRFQKEHAALDQQLCQDIDEAIQSGIHGGLETFKAIRPLNEELYEAYKIMKSYELTNEELFS